MPIVFVGVISMQEFEEAVTLLSQHIQSPIPKSDIEQMARNIDINKDGFIDFSEFLEAFRVINNLGESLNANRRPSDDSIRSHDSEPVIEEVARWNCTHL